MRTVAQRDPVTGRYLTGNNGAQVGPKLGRHS
jgi:hypothetical protein